MLKLSLILSFFAVNVFAANQYKVTSKQIGNVLIPFVVNANGSEQYFDQKASFADVEKMAPINLSALASLKPNDIRQMSMEEFNQLYARLGSGPMPLGDYAGYVLQKPPVYNAIKKRIIKQVMFAQEFAKLAKMACGREGEDCLFEFIWKGKRFWPKNDMDQIMTMSLFNPVSAGFKFSLTPDFLKGPFLDKTLNFAEGLIDKASPLLFPMNTYCGISQTDTRRESIITDAGFADDFSLPWYIGLRDQVITRKGLNITEEYRMVRPGLYIGKVYSNKLFLFNVALEKTGNTVPTETKNACLDTIKTY